MILCLVSSILLILSHPPFDFWFLAWIGFAPLMMALNKDKNTGSLSLKEKTGSLCRAFGLGYLCGVFFFAGTLYWFIHVTLPGALLIILHLATYFGIFACACRASSRKSGISRLFFLSSFWVILEFIRSKLFTGFDWVSLGHSQYKVLPLIQISDITGVFGVSFLVIMVNVFIAERSRRSATAREWFAVTGFLFLSLCYGAFRLYVPLSYEGAPVEVAVVQANIDQEIKWQPWEWPNIMERYKELTREAIRHNPDIIIWPETAFPGYIWESPEMFEGLKSFVAELKVPLLFGAVTKEGEKYYNSAILLSGEGKEIARHNKLHLVPFGEYVPLRKYFPFLAEIVPVEDFTPGEQLTLFPAVPGEAGKPLPVLPFSIWGGEEFNQNFSVLICFEDTVAGVARRLVKAGAGLLVNITNDAWFLDTNAPLLHLQSAVFRTVENRRGLIRVANTGVSCFIDKFGRVYNTVKDSRGKTTYVSGYAVDTATLSNDETLYTKSGDIFTMCCFGCILWGMIKRNKG